MEMREYEEEVIGWRKGSMRMRLENGEEGV